MEQSHELLSLHKAKMVWVFYGNGREDNIYIETHDVIGGKIADAKPLQEDTVRDLAVVLRKQTQMISRNASLLPKNILYLDNSPSKEEIVWYTNPKQVWMYFRKDIKLESGKYPVPQLIWHYSKGRLFVLTTGTKKRRPTRKTILLRSPFHNVNEDCLVCMGSGRFNIGRRDTIREVMREVEKVFYMTAFSHISGSDPCKNGIENYWKSSLQKSALNLDTDLYSTNKKGEQVTLQEYIENL